MLLRRIDKGTLVARRARKVRGLSRDGPAAERKDPLLAHSEVSLRATMPTRRPLLAVAFTVGWLMLAGYVALTTGWLLPNAHTELDKVVFNGVLVLSTALVCWRVHAVKDDRAPWVAFAAALLMWTAGFIVYDAFVAGRDPLPYPSIADFFWIAFYPGVYAGLLLMLRSRVRHLPTRFWFQGPIALLGLSALVAALVFEPIMRSTGGDVATLVTTLLYPIGDLIALGFVLTIFAVTGGHPGRGAALVTLAFAIEFPADITYVFQSASGTLKEDGVLDMHGP